VKRILVIDDEAELRELAAETLRHGGYKADAAPDGAAGLALAFEDPPDLVLCDLQMDGLDGYQVLASLRRNPRTAVIPVIFLTGVGGADAIRKGMNLGADDYLVKPVTGATLLATVGARLERSLELRQEAARRLAALRDELARSLLPHELLTPLTAVMGLASLLTDPVAVEADQVPEAAQGILLGAQEMETTITKFLRYAEILTSQPGEALGPAEAALIVGETARARAARAGREADLVLDVESFRSPMTSDHLQALVQELVDNALKSSEPGSPIAVQGGRQGEAGFLHVEDRGRGMSAEQIAGLERAPFLRRNQEQPGLGLGLTIVRRLVAMYAGTLSFDTARGRGTTARVRV
jgi:two-component system, sensor histidine kinase and response regulator